MSCENVKECMCPKNACPNHGKCCACVTKHRLTDSLPYCLFPDNGGDKSNRNHYEVLKRRFEGVKVLGTGCKSCHALWEAAQEAVRSMGLGVEVEYVTDLQQIMAYGVMSMPALVVNEQVVSMGKVLKAPDIERLLSAMISRS